MDNFPRYSNRKKSRWLAALTFLAVCASFVVVGLAVVPFVIRRMETRYLDIQADVNARQAKALARYADLRLKEGRSPNQVSRELQILLSGADREQGFSCVVDQLNFKLVCYPDAEALGTAIAGRGISFGKVTEAAKSANREPWEDALGRGFSGAGSLLYPGGKMETVHMEKIPGTRWTVATHENTAMIQSELKRLRSAMIVGSAVIGLLLAIPSSLAARVVSRRHEKQVESEQERSERLLLNILPPPIAERLKADEQIIADRHSQVTVLFADIVGFTPMAAKTSATELVEWLNRIFSRFDDICASRGLEKIKTIGDAYMLCGGLDGDADADEAAVEVVGAGLEMIDALGEMSASAETPALQLRVGVHTGELVAGVIGKRKFSYDLWGDVVNTASRLESNGLPGRVQISRETSERMRDQFVLEPRGEIAVKGKGNMPVWLVGSRGGAK